MNSAGFTTCSSPMRSSHAHRFEFATELLLGHAARFAGDDDLLADRVRLDRPHAVDLTQRGVDAPCTRVAVHAARTVVVSQLRPCGAVGSRSRLNVIEPGLAEDATGQLTERYVAPLRFAVMLATPNAASYVDDGDAVARPQPEWP